MKISQRDAAAMDDLDNALGSESGYTGARRIVILSAAVYRPGSGPVWRTG